MVANTQGWFPDGWAAPRVEYLLPRGTKAVRVRGSVPDMQAALNGQSLRVTCNGQAIGEVALPVGDFAVTFGLPAEASLSCANIVLDASRWLVPKALGTSPDSRRLAYVLHEVNEIGEAYNGSHPPGQERD